MLNRKIIYLDEVTSTNSYALERLNELEDGTVIVTNTQTNGKGRYGRNWISGSFGNVCLSIVLKPQKIGSKMLPITNITQYMAVIICRILSEYGVNATLKWPNDILVDWKKIAGVLAETSIKGDRLEGLVVGIGLNLSLTSQDVDFINQPAIALNLLIDKVIDRDVFIEKLLDNFFLSYESFIERGFSMIKDEYCDRSSFLGHRVAINSPAGVCFGIAEDLDDCGTLIMRTDKGEKEIINIGDME